MNDPPLFQETTAIHLINFIPFGMQAFLDCFALEQLVADLQDTIRVGLALDKASEKFILPFQVKGLQEVNPQDSLWTQRKDDNSLRQCIIHKLMYLEHHWLCWHRGLPLIALVEPSQVY